MTATPPIVGREAWQEQIEALRVREKAHTRESDATGVAPLDYALLGRWIGQHADLVRAPYPTEHPTLPRGARDVRVCRTARATLPLPPGSRPSVRRCVR